MRPFDDTDYFAFAGAEDAAGCPALIGEVGNLMIVVDYNSMCIIRDSATYVHEWRSKLPYHVAKIVAEKIETMDPKEITRDFLLGLGFTVPEEEWFME